MTDQEIIQFIRNLVTNHRSDCERCVIAVNRDKLLHCVIASTPKRFFKENGETAIEIPKLPKDNEQACLELALYLGRRLERFERAVKANAGRSAESRQKIAQNAIQARWSAK